MSKIFQHFDISTGFNFNILILVYKISAGNFRSNTKYYKSDNEPCDNNSESASLIKGTITLIYNYINKC